MGRESQNFVTALAALFAEKRDELFGKTINWIRTRLSFALIWSSILCIRGTKTIRRPKLIDISDTDINIIESVGYITNWKFYIGFIITTRFFFISNSLISNSKIWKIVKQLQFWILRKLLKILENSEKIEETEQK